MNKTDNKKKGDWGERIAADYLESKGFRILEKQWNYTRFEIDLIVRKENTIVFVEVKTRFSRDYGEPWDAVNKAKQKKICKSADFYLKNFCIDSEPRFDIISIVHDNGKTEITHLDNAFYPTL
jgi:putative endonuclease